MTGGTTVLVVDDEKKIREILVSYLEAYGYRVVSAGGGEEALALFAKHPVSVVLLDLMLPGMTGEEVCRRIREISSVPVIMITAKIEEKDVVHGLSLGADDYVTKPFGPREIVARVAAVLRRTGIAGGGAKREAVYTRGEITVDTENRRVAKNGRPLVLTPSEYRIMALLASRPEKVFSRDEIIDAAKNDDFDGVDRAIDVHISNLRQKVEDNPKKPRFIVTVYGMGYRFGDAP
ncbi:MAG: response regulator transcription factor [Spirochaetaceae bacterium]|jgi:DNA-binding response OmpR family regulator|nr:response regulator transcription factor [Spirochaetaceae bacterium]